MALSRNSSEPAEDPGAVPGSIIEPANEANAPAASGPRQAPSTRVSWSSEDPSVLIELLQAHTFSEAMIERLVQCAAAPPHTKHPIDRLAIALGANFNFLTVVEALERPVLLFGLPGAGTSTMVSKLAARFDASELIVISVGDPASEKATALSEWLEVLDLPLAVASNPRKLQEAMALAKGRKVVIDFALPALDRESVARLRETLAATDAEGVLVLSAETAPDKALAATKAAAASGVRRAVLTYVDTTRYLGSALEAIESNKLALMGASVTPHFGFGLRTLTPENLARRLMSAAANSERWRVAPL